MCCGFGSRKGKRPYILRCAIEKGLSLNQCMEDHEVRTAYTFKGKLRSDWMNNDYRKLVGDPIPGAGTIEGSRPYILRCSIERGLSLEQCMEDHEVRKAYTPQGRLRSDWIKNDYHEIVGCSGSNI